MLTCIPTATQESAINSCQSTTTVQSQCGKKEQLHFLSYCCCYEVVCLNVCLLLGSVLLLLFLLLLLTLDAAH